MNGPTNVDTIGVVDDDGESLAMRLLSNPFYATDIGERRRLWMLMSPAIFGVAVVACQPERQRFSQMSDDTATRAPVGNSTDDGWRELFVVANGRFHVRAEKIGRDKQRGADLIRESGELISNNQFKQALDTLGAAASALPESSIVYERLGQILLFKGRIEAATYALRAAIDEDSRNSGARTLFARSLMAEGRIGEAIDQWLMVAVLGGDVGEVHENLAICFYYERDYETAQRHLTKADKVGHNVPSHFRAMLSARLADARSGDSR